MNIVKATLSLILISSMGALAQKYEAETAILTNGAKNVNNASASGGACVSMQGGNISFEGVTIETAGKYTLSIHYKADEYKANYLVVNGEQAATLDFDPVKEWTDIKTAVTLKAGANTIALENFWGWITVDYIEISAYESSSFKIASVPVTPEATESAVKLYSFLAENFGKRTISGIMTGSMDSYTAGDDFKTHEDVENIYNRSGKYPALVGVDFLFASGPNAGESWYMEYTDKAMSIAKDLWKKGGIPAFTWHWKDPLDKVDAFYIEKAANGGDFTDFDFSTAFKAGTLEWDTESAAYKGIIDDIDHIADYFLDLQNEGVAGIFRPLHEAGGLWFWWSINSGEQYAALYRLVYDRMVKVKGVKNMIWVFNPNSSAVTTWDPGREYYDIISIDIYNNDNDYSSNSSSFEKYKKATDGTKIIALTENGPIPDVNKMHDDEAVWSWWMPWYGSWGGKYPGQTSNDVWKANMADERIITLEDMPGWDKYTYTPTTSLPKSPIRISRPNTSTDKKMYNVKGGYMGMSNFGKKISSGMYIQCDNGSNFIKPYLNK